MKKILIVNNNMHVGGVQKSLYNLLWEIEGKYDITLCLFRGVGAYMDKLPPGIKVVECSGPFRYLGISQGECINVREKLSRGFLAILSRLFGRAKTIKLMLCCQPMLPGEYDCAIAYLHNGRVKSFYGGVQDFVLRRVKAGRKVAFLHCDYGQCGANHEDNNRLIAEFNAVAACSDGCSRAFCAVLPELADKCITVRNVHRVEEIRTLAADEPIAYDDRQINVLMVSRLAHEKGVERAVRAVAHCLRGGIPVTLHLVGDGPMKGRIVSEARMLNVEDAVFFYGEKKNPYRYMKNADLLFMTSYHEAAPMVIDEANLLGIPVLTAATTSSEEMVIHRGCGWVCENTDEAITEMLKKVLCDGDALRGAKERICDGRSGNAAALAQFAMLIEG